MNKLLVVGCCGLLALSAQAVRTVSVESLPKIELEVPVPVAAVVPPPPPPAASTTIPDPEKDDLSPELPFFRDDDDELTETPPLPTEIA